MSKTDMTKTEAIEQMKAGVKMRHRYFSDHEWCTMEDGRIVLEDGVKCSPVMFWMDRTQDSWNTGWQTYESWIS